VVGENYKNILSTSLGYQSKTLSGPKRNKDYVYFVNGQAVYELAITNGHSRKTRYVERFFSPVAAHGYIS
jgi:hypothetical protein